MPSLAIENAIELDCENAIDEVFSDEYQAENPVIPPGIRRDHIYVRPMINGQIIGCCDSRTGNLIAHLRARAEDNVLARCRRVLAR